MQIRLKIKPEGSNFLELPLHYNYLVQGAIYKNIFPELADFLHNQGYRYEKRSFKMFSFSRFMGRFKINKSKKTITFLEEPTLVITTPVSEILQSLGNFILKDKIILGNKEVVVTKIETQRPCADGGEILLKTLSPVTAYSTATLPDGRRYTIYHEPGDKNFLNIINGNLRKKYFALYEKKAPETPIHMRVIQKPKQNLIKYKGTIIKGYSFRFKLAGPKELLQLALDAGIGAKNSQGFGCVTISN